MAQPQTSYSVNPARGVPGMLSRIGTGKHKTVHMRADGAVTPGKWVTFSGDDAAHPTAAPSAGTKGGVALRNMYQQDDGVIADNEMFDVLVDGYCFIDPEVTCTADQQAWVRFSGTVKGDFRSDPGTLGLTYTVVTATNSSKYIIVLDGLEFFYVSDADATTAEIATGLAAAIDAHASYVATNPTSTTILVVKVTTSTLEVVAGAYDARLTLADGSVAFKPAGAYYQDTGSGVIELRVTET